MFLTFTIDNEHDVITVCSVDRRVKVYVTNVLMVHQTLQDFQDPLSYLHQFCWHSVSGCPLMECLFITGHGSVFCKVNP